MNRLNRVNRVNRVGIVLTMLELGMFIKELK